MSKNHLSDKGNVSGCSRTLKNIIPIAFSGYDSGEKKRIPAWCDRILYRDSRSSLLTDCSLECPVVSSITE